MSAIRQNVSLQQYNTFGLEARARYFAEINSIDDFLHLLKDPTYLSSEKLILGGGSNILFTRDFEGLVLLNRLHGIEVVSESDSSVVVKAAAGENWHQFVEWCIQRGFGGIENLSLIPGCVGASPMQNIGAYGVEIKEVFHSLEAYDLNTGSKRVFTGSECKFGYRESVFKHEYKNRFLITAVSFVLSKNPKINTSYGAITTELSAMQVKSPTIADVSRAVMNIRRSKLPDPSVTGNAGSFFKNPEIGEEQFRHLKEKFSDLVSYPLPDGRYKLAAGWLIEQCGLKGHEIDGAAVHTKQALVLINKGNASGDSVYKLSSYVIGQVEQKFGVKLEREVNII